MSAAADTYYRVPRRRSIVARFLGSRFVAVVVIVAAIIAIWYVGALALNAPFQRDLDSSAGITRGARRFRRRGLQPAEADAAGAASGRARHLQDRRACRSDQAVEPALPRLGDALLDARRLRLRHAARHRARRRHRPCAQPRQEPDAVDDLVADDPHPGARADPRRGGLQPADRPVEDAHRRQPLRRQGADLDLPVVLPGHGRHGEGPALARSDPPRPDAHLQRHALADVLEAALAGVAAVPVRLDEGRRRREPGRRHRRRTADRRRRRHRRQAARRLLLQPVDPDVVGAGRRLGAGRAARRRGRHRRAHHRPGAWAGGRDERVDRHAAPDRLAELGRARRPCRGARLAAGRASAASRTTCSAAAAVRCFPRC